MKSDIIALFTVHEADWAVLAGDVDQNDPLSEIYLFCVMYIYM